MDSINQQIADDTFELGPGYCIGHSFFCPNGNQETLGMEWYKRILDTQIFPLISEYYFDRPDKVDELKLELLS